MRRPTVNMLVAMCVALTSVASPAIGQELISAPEQRADSSPVTNNLAPGDPYQRAAISAEHVPQVANNTIQPTGNPSHGPLHGGQTQLGAPFQLDQMEQQFVDQILTMWEEASDKIKTFACEFERWEYDPVFGPGNEIPMIKSRGQLTYSKPDKGSFKINEVLRYTQKDEAQPGKYVLQEHEVGEHWVCDGQAVFEYKHDKKQLVVQPLPQEMRGQSIVDGPLPFLFGAEAAKLKSRYWIRTKESDPARIHLEAYPRTQVDAANYHHVEVILDRKTMHPTAIQVHMPNGTNRSVYIFQQPTVNGKLDQLFGALFKQPRTPLGWTRVVEQMPPNPQATQGQDTQHR